MPAGLYVSVSTAYGQWNTPIKTVRADCSVPWNESLIIQRRPLMVPQWLKPIFPSTSKTAHLEIRASFETVMLGRGELVGKVEIGLEELLVYGKQFGLHATIQPSEIDITTDAAHEAYTLYRQSNHHNDLDIAIKRFEIALDQCPPGHLHRAAALSNIAHAILYGFTKG
ncbi:hypothetical protein AZE42_13247, partial [Rhizopogon vesiculosus]